MVFEVAILIVADDSFKCAVFLMPVNKRGVIGRLPALSSNFNFCGLTIKFYVFFVTDSCESFNKRTARCTGRGTPVASEQINLTQRS